ncbi:MAG: hypothetical protein RIE84_14295 [Parvibaculum sp.]|uniref:hypothetical protein n=1 Tax=Parvibaculum sp. TaxID=2024848 RepID=UPI0032EFDE89
MRNLKRTGYFLVLSILLSGCETTNLGGAIGQGVIEGLLMGPSGSYGAAPSAPAPSRQQTSVSSGSSGGSYLDRMAAQSQQRLLSTAPCDPAARAHWRERVRANSQGIDVGDLYKTPPHCRN